MHDLKKWKAMQTALFSDNHNFFSIFIAEKVPKPQTMFIFLIHIGETQCWPNLQNTQHIFKITPFNEL